MGMLFLTLLIFNHVFLLMFKFMFIHNWVQFSLRVSAPQYTDYRLSNHKFQPLEALRGCAQNSTTIVLSHNPASAHEIAYNDAHLRVDLIVSG